MLVDVDVVLRPGGRASTPGRSARAAGRGHRVVHGVVGRPRVDRPAGTDLDGDGVRHDRSVPSDGWITMIEPSRAGRSARVGQGDRGSGFVAGIALIFAFTFLGLVWLARDVDRSVSNRSTAQSIAFQAARSGAQAAFVPELRTGDAVAVDASAAQSGRRDRRRRRCSPATTWSARSRRSKSMTTPSRCRSTITDAGKTVTGLGTVRSERAP